MDIWKGLGNCRVVVEIFEFEKEGSKETRKILTQLQDLNIQFSVFFFILFNFASF